MTTSGGEGAGVGGRNTASSSVSTTTASSFVTTSTAVAAATLGLSAASLYLWRSRQQGGRTSHHDGDKQGGDEMSVPPPPPPSRVGTVSHVHIRVTDLRRSVRFYRDMGFLLLPPVVVDGNSNDGDGGEKIDIPEGEKYALLQTPRKPPSKNKKNDDDEGPEDQQPYLLLEEDPKHQTRTMNAASPGIARICIMVSDVHLTIQQLSSLGYTYLTPPITDRPGTTDVKTGKNPHPEVTIVTYPDPDGNYVELVSITSGIIGLSLKTMEYLDKIQYPIWVHININATSYERSWLAYQQLGFTTISQDYGRVVNNLYKALGIPDDEGIAGQVALIQLPEGKRFSIDLIEWENQKKEGGEVVANGDSGEGAVRGEMGTSMGFAVTVEDVPMFIDNLLACSSSSSNASSSSKKNDRDDDSDAGVPGSTSLSKYWTVSSPIQCILLPQPLGYSIQATVRDPDGVDVTLVSYPRSTLVYPRVCPPWPPARKTMPTTTPSSSTFEKENGKRVVLVTGCDSGFGRSLAIQLIGLGYHVVASCYTHKGAYYFLNLATEGLVTTVISDLSSDEGVQRVIDITRQLLLDGDKKKKKYYLWGIVNNAGMCHPGHVQWTEPRAYKHVMALNFHAPVTLVHNLLPHMKSHRRGGRIINVTSVCGIVSSPSNSTYCASKFALESWSDALRVELMPYGNIHVVVMEPTTMKTPLGMGWSDLWIKHYKGASPDLRRNYPREWAEKFYEFIDTSLVVAGEDPFIAVRHMIRALVVENEEGKIPPSRVLCGEGAKGYYALSRMSDEQRDTLFKDPIGGIGYDS